MEFVPVAIPQSESELSVMVCVLEANDIPHFVQNRDFGGLFPGMKMHLINGQRVMVPIDQFFEATELLSVFREPPTDFETDIKLAFRDRLRTIAELLLVGWSFPMKYERVRRDDDENP